MRSWIEIFDIYMLDVTGVTIKAACDSLRNAAQVFCERTKVWRADLDPLLTFAGQDVYDFDMDSEVEIVKVFKVKLSGNDIPLLIDARAGEQCVQVITPVQFRLLPPAQVAGQRIEFNVALEPSNTASGIEDWVADKYARLLAKGAKAELFAQPNRPYTDINAALALRAEFDMDVANVKGDIAAAFSTAPVRTKAQFL